MNFEAPQITMGGRIERLGTIYGNLWDCDGSKYADDRNDDEQFNQCKTFYPGYTCHGNNSRVGFVRLFS